MAQEQQFRVLLLGFAPAEVDEMHVSLTDTPFDLTTLEDWADLNRHQSALVLLNCTAADGLEVLRQLLDRTRLPVVAITRPEDGLAALEIGAWDFVTQGEVKPHGLSRALRYTLNNSRLADRLSETLHQLHESELRFQDMVARTADSIIVVDWDGVIHFVNSAAEALFERDAGSLVGTSLGFPVAGEDLTELEIIQSADEITVAQMRVIETQWGGQHAYLLSLRELPNYQERRKAIDHIMRRNHQFANAVTNLSVGVVITAPTAEDNPIIFVNAGFTKLTGYSAEDVVGRNCRFLQGPDTDRAVIARMRDAIANARSFSDRLLNYRQDGTPFWNELRITPVFDGEGKLINFVGLLHDVTLRKEAEDAMLEKERLRIALEKERELGRVKNLFMSTISHEFRTPLTIIQTASELLERYHSQLNSEQRIERLHNIQGQVAHLSDMLDEITIIIHAESGRLEFVPEEVEMVGFCGELVQNFRLAYNTGHTIEFAAAVERVYMHADPRLLRHIFNNLLTNAIKYSSRDQPVRFELEREADAVLIRIADGGIGIPENEHLRLFEPFYRASNVGSIEGTGLGLKVVHDCLAIHHGTIKIESVEGQGTMALVRLPLAST